ncbi:MULTISPECIES: hypothetical protein [Nostocales]|uniref:Uncharacterized protein n=3 Tax=Nostocales TaxID=1161 RepID=A0A0C1R2I1_9CYAN|nr:hypothetical protein [Tolypothrix bouteillei]KAF3885922.1 hypothetical protein DA73_0400010915 [Tolypothrix bouteillei VB521301]
MRTGVKRIEATLHDLGTRNTASTEPETSTKKALSFRISLGTSEASSSTEIPTESELTTQLEQDLPPHDNSVQTFPAQENGCKTPSLPKLKTPNFSSHRNAANPGLAMNILLEIQETVASWQTELQTIVKQIQDIYLEGPIVNGWLESRERESQPGGTATLRHAEVDRLMDYVEEICTSDSNVACQSPRAGYRLCGLDASGRVWSRPCPQEQVASVSVAIARYQKLRQLLGRKQYLETRLAQLAETLVILHGHIQAQ